MASVPVASVSKRTKRKPGEKSSATCDLCCCAIKDGEDSLTCDGVCQKQINRYCAGVTVTCHKRIIESSSPFVCLTCTQKMHSTIVSNLQGEIETLKNELSNVKALLLEEKNLCDPAPAMEAIASLRNDLQNLCTQVETQPSSYAEVILSQPHPIEKKVVFRPNKNIPPKPIEPKLTELNVSKGNRNRVVVEGARRIWGTLRSATNKSITN